jgi:DNA invertase Pin-like site-specific DNA recombinase
LSQVRILPGPPTSVYDEAGGAALNLDTATATGRMMLTLIGAIAQFERELMLERQREGIAKAKAAGKYRGRAPTARAKLDQIRALQSQGVGASEIARRLGIGRASVYRLLGSQPA